MKNVCSLLLSIGLFLLCGCAVFDAGQPAEAPVMQPKPLAVPVGASWQIVEKAPKLSDERGRLPFQTEQSVQPEGAGSVPPAVKRTIETSQ